MELHNGIVDEVELNLIDLDPTQPRRDFDEDGLAQLANSMASEGLLQPISLRKNGGGRYIIIAGERRYRAADRIGWDKIPAIIREVDDGTSRKLQMIENVVRSDLNPVEYAQGLKKMLDEGMTAKEIGQAIGDDPGNISFHVAILQCREEVLQLLSTGQIGVVVARQMAYLSENAQMLVLRRFQSHRYDTTEQVAICQRQFALENQQEMFPDVQLTKEQVEVVKTLRTAFNAAGEAFKQLRQMEAKQPGIIIQANVTQLDIAQAQVTELKKNIDWLYRVLKQKEALNGKSERLA